MTGRDERPAATVELLVEDEVVLVQSDDVTIGRTPKCTVRVVHPLVSREHCRLEPRADGLFVVDLAAVNGTWLNGTRVTARTQARAGDRLGLGREGAVIVVRSAVVGGVDVSRLPREEDMNTMIAGDPRAAGAVARVEVAPEAMPALGVADEPTRSASSAPEIAAAAPPRPAPAPEPGTVEVVAAVAAPQAVVAASPAAPAPTNGAAAARRRGFVVGFVVGLAAVAAVAKFTHAFDAVRARPSGAGVR